MSNEFILTSVALLYCYGAVPVTLIVSFNASMILYFYIYGIVFYTAVYALPI